MMKKKQAMKTAARPTRCKCAERVSGILYKRESLPGANEVGGHDRGKHCMLSTYERSTLYYLALYTAAVLSCAVEQNRSYEKCAGLLAPTCSSSSAAASRYIYLATVLHRDRDAATF